MGVIGHAKWCGRKGLPSNMEGRYCSTCGKRIHYEPEESEETRLRRLLAGAVEDRDRLAAWARWKIAPATSEILDGPEPMTLNELQAMLARLEGSNS